MPMVVTSFMTDAEINSFPPKRIPSAISLAGYLGFVGDSPAPWWMLTTRIVTAIPVASHLVLCSRADTATRG